MKRVISVLAILLSFWAFSQEKEVSSENEPFVKVNESATFPGGVNAWNKYLESNLKYPDEAISNGVEGRVFIQCIVEKNGKGTDIFVIKGIGAGCDEEALRLIKEMPRWIPAKKDGRIVRQKIVFNIHFSLRPTRG